MPAVPIASLNAFACTGIYFLYHEGLVVYVGQAINMRRRIADHIGEGQKLFDAASFIQCRREQLLSLERAYIEKLVPKYNRSIANAIRADYGPALEYLPQASVPGTLLNTDQAAEFLGLTVSALDEMRTQGSGPEPRRLPRSKSRRFRVHDLREFALLNAELLQQYR